MNVSFPIVRKTVGLHSGGADIARQRFAVDSPRPGTAKGYRTPNANSEIWNRPRPRRRVRDSRGRLLKFRIYAKCSAPPARSEACTREKRNKRQGLASGGKDAVYIGFDLEQAQRYAG